MNNFKSRQFNINKGCYDRIYLYITYNERNARIKQKHYPDNMNKGYSGKS